MGHLDDQDHAVKEVTTPSVPTQGELSPPVQPEVTEAPDQAESKNTSSAESQQEADDTIKKLESGFNSNAPAFVHKPASKQKPKGKEGGQGQVGHQHKAQRASAQQFSNMYAPSDIQQLKMKYKTQLCRHYTDSGTCSLAFSCLFAHGSDELREPNDPLPHSFGMHAMGAVYSNYKTEPCKNWYQEGECKFGEACSFYHNDKEKRKLIDPVPALPEGVNLPPMPDKLKNYRNKQQPQNQNHFTKQTQQAFQTRPPQAQQQPFFQPPQQQQQQPVNQNFYFNQNPLFQIQSIHDLATMCNNGFNPDKYMSPFPVQQYPFAENPYSQGGYPPGMNFQQMPAPVQKPSPAKQKKGDKGQSKKKDKAEGKKYVTKAKTQEKGEEKPATASC